MGKSDFPNDLMTPFKGPLMLILYFRYFGSQMQFQNVLLSKTIEFNMSKNYFILMVYVHEIFSNMAAAVAWVVKRLRKVNLALTLVLHHSLPL